MKHRISAAILFILCIINVLDIYSAQIEWDNRDGEAVKRKVTLGESSYNHVEWR
jgi:hypothetical protein